MLFLLFSTNRYAEEILVEVPFAYAPQVASRDFYVNYYMKARTSRSLKNDRLSVASQTK